VEKSAIDEIIDIDNVNVINDNAENSASTYLGVSIHTHAREHPSKSPLKSRGFPRSLFGVTPNIFSCNIRKRNRGKINMLR